MSISVSSISVTLPKQKEPLFQISQLEVPKGSRLLIQGPSGKGKTTFLHLLAGLFFPDKGTVRVKGQSLDKMGDEELCQFRRNYYGIIFQKLNLLDHLTSHENVALAASPQQTMEQKIDEILKKLGLGERIYHRAGQLSLGEQQRVAVARILLRRPDIVLADEPTSSLDDKNADSVIETLFSLPASTTMVVVSHDHRIESHFSDRLNFDELVTQ